MLWMKNTQSYRHDWKASSSGHMKAFSIHVIFEVKSEGWLENYYTSPKLKSIQDFSYIRLC